jgi:hypothetical protein
MSAVENDGYFLGISLVFPCYGTCHCLVSVSPSGALSVSPSVSPTVSSSLHYDALPGGVDFTGRLRVQEADGCI